jgi:hypothetical protein
MINERDVSMSTSSGVTVKGLKDDTFDWDTSTGTVCDVWAVQFMWRFMMP